MFDGTVLGPHSAAGVIDREGEKVNPHAAMFEWSFDMIHEGAYDPKARLEVLDECGIDAQIIYPSTIGLGGRIWRDRRPVDLADGDRNLQRRPGRDPGQIGQPAAAAAADAGMGRRRFGRRGKQVAAMGARGINMTLRPQ